MALTCPQCGADNRDTAKFCRTCAHQLVALGPSTDAAPTDAEVEAAARARRRRRRARRAVARTASPALRVRAGWVLLSLALLIALGVLGWSRDVRDHSALASEARPAPPAPPVRATEAVSAAQPAASPTPAPESAAVARAAQAVQALQAQQRAPAQAGAAQAPAPESVAKPQRRAANRTLRAPHAAPPPEAEPKPAELPVASAPPPAARAAPQRPGVLCGDERFLARALCLQRACDQPGMGGHPQCVRMRELQQALRNPDRGG